MQVILEMINEFVDKELIPLEPDFLNREFVDLLPVLEEKRKMVRQMELWAPNHPRELGGMGLDLVEHGLVSEVLGRTPIGHYVFNCQAPDAGNIEILHKFGTPDQIKEFLVPLVAGPDPQLFFHDRSGHARLQPGHDGNHRRKGRGGLCDQRPQMVHLLGRWGRICHCDGGHRSGCPSTPPGQYDYRSGRYPRVTTWCATFR
jgi:hypothetical protein